MQRTVVTVFIFWMILFIFPVTANAYIGPGLGLGALGAVLGVFFSIILAVFAIFWYPIKRLIKKFRLEK